MSSLLTSLIRAGTQFQQALEKRSTRTDTPADTRQATADAAVETDPASAGDDRFTPTGAGAPDPFRQKVQRLALADYKQTLGKDVAFVRDTLRHKLAEYNVHPATALSVTRQAGGELAVEGKLPDSTRRQIETDLNHNQGFREAITRLSASEPTLHFVDTAVKLSQAYGVGNTLLETLVSEDQQFNGLQDLVHRYQTLRRNVESTTGSASDTASRYAFSLNVRA
ncbi:hypothetical protein [Marinobacter lutaoensis]|jgi:hypothetical protein|uniref:Uncharacterized protein n=1 Tax=Marinobacter lutaoensis TaxID=135739 RepID=A0A1V2DT60_9GAMM|nr:hypothetical protein [Marinobacter lutaoensis]MBI44408.1 hypothetical protein [Oceanospirillales bacterium]NVD35796.1 hypothetical protein [Marinobacter lutaoensis]ONF43853.1 hypothetical protein BTO32_09385 [Marinobacter lutaoensis]|tara:strand:- start:650 stop:1321 length:672 start_codon:yes stop_codon:yes gene_type:complete